MFLYLKLFILELEDAVVCEVGGAGVPDVLVDMEGGGGGPGVPEEEEQATSRLPGAKQYIWPSVSSILM